MLRYLLIAEDHPICASALTMAAQSRDSAIVVDVCPTLTCTQAKLVERRYDAMVLDLGLQDSQGLINLTLLRGEHPKLPILIVSAMPGDALPATTRSMGANGFLTKDAALDQMGDAIETVLAGKEYFTEEPAPDYPVADRLNQLSNAQLRVMQELVSGQSNKVIAYNLGLAEATVKSHLSAIYRAFGVTNRSEAILELKRMYGGVMLS